MIRVYSAEFARVCRIHSGRPKPCRFKDLGVFGVIRQSLQDFIRSVRIRVYSQELLPVVQGFGRQFGLLESTSNSRVVWRSRFQARGDRQRRRFPEIFDGVLCFCPNSSAFFSKIPVLRNEVSAWVRS